MPAQYLQIRDWRQRIYPYAGEPVFIRFGLWDARARSRNHATDEREAGVSVYCGQVVDGAADLAADLADDVPPEYTEELRGRIAFAVTGEVAGVGSDGEPVLRRVRLLDLPLRLSVRQEAVAARG